MIARIAGLIIALISLSCALPVTASKGVIFEQTESVGYDDIAAVESLARLNALGAEIVAVVPFVWQSAPDATDPIPGSSVSLDQLRAGIRAAKEKGMTVAVKPHVWIPGTWAGVVNPNGAQDWNAWFDAYKAALSSYARVAEEAGADVFFVGTELRQSLHKTASWRRVVAQIRKVFDGQIAYAAHGLDDFRRVKFTDELDILGVTLYPPLDDDFAGTIQGIAQALAHQSRRMELDVWVAEIGLRSATGSLSRPWESPSERAAQPAPLLQAEVFAYWLTALDRPEIAATLVYRWFTDPAAGGRTDTDFSPQNKPAEGVMLCIWKDVCTP